MLAAVAIGWQGWGMRCVLTDGITGRDDMQLASVFGKHRQYPGHRHGGMRARGRPRRSSTRLGIGQIASPVAGWDMLYAAPLTVTLSSPSSSPDSQASAVNV